MSEFKPIILGIGNGLKDSIIGMASLVTLDSTIEKTEADRRRRIEEFHSQRQQYRGNIRARPRKESGSPPSKQILKTMIQCCLLNGGIFWMSILLFECYIIPFLQFLTQTIFRLISGDSAQHSSIWYWMGPALTCVFGALWVLPLFWLSKPLNSLWFQEIADTAYRKTRGRPLGFLHMTRGESVTSYASRTIADFSFSILLQAFFLIQGLLVSFLPIFGPVASFLHMCLLYSLYVFEYKWVNMDWSAPKRLAYIESNWPYFVGFGLPLAVITSLPSSIVVSGCVFAIFFPLFIISGNVSSPAETNQFPIRIFAVVVWITNKVFHRSKTKQGPTSPLDTSSPLRDQPPS